MYQMTLLRVSKNQKACFIGQDPAFLVSSGLRTIAFGNKQKTKPASKNQKI